MRLNHLICEPVLKRAGNGWGKGRGRETEGRLGKVRAERERVSE